jgi:hypothetical protein
VATPGGVARILVQPLPIAVRDVLAEHPTTRPLAEDEHVVEVLAAHAPEVLPCGA